MLDPAANFFSIKHLAIFSFEELNRPVNPGIVIERNSVNSLLSLFSEIFLK